MFNFRNTWMATCLLALGCLLLSGVNRGAEDKKEDKKKAEKKKEEPKKKPKPLLNKSEELKADDEKDTKRTKSPCKIYPVKLTADTRYQIDLKSKDFDAYLRLLDFLDNEVAFNDDIDPSTFDARIVYQAAKTSVYKIVVTSYDGKAGKFTVTAIETDKKTPLATGSKFTGKASELKLKVGKTTYVGELSEKDPAAFKRYYKLFTVPLEKDQSYLIENRAADPKTLDAYLFLEDADGAPLESDRISGADSSPRIIYKAAQTGIFRIIATSAREQQTGKFTLDIGPAPDTKKTKKSSRMERPGDPAATIVPALGLKIIRRELPSLGEPPSANTLVVTCP
jgi:hypothetical protein